MLISHDWTTTVHQSHDGTGIPSGTFGIRILDGTDHLLARTLELVLAGVALEHTISRRGRGRAAREMDQFVACSLGTLLMVLLSFYNPHLTFYHNYLHMIVRWKIVFFKRYARLQPLAILYGPLMVLSVWTGIIAMWNEKEGNLDEVVVLGQGTVSPPSTTSISSSSNASASNSPVGGTTK